MKKYAMRFLSMMIISILAVILFKTKHEAGAGFCCVLIIIGSIILFLEEIINTNYPF